MLKRKIISIDGVGDQYSQRLNNAGIITIEHLLDVSPVELYERTGIPASRLYEFKRKAQIIQEIEIDPNDYESLLSLDCSKILSSKVSELERTSRISSDKIRILKEKLSNLYVAVDNDVIKDANLSEVVEYSKNIPRKNVHLTNIDTKTKILTGTKESINDGQTFDISMDLNNDIIRGINDIIAFLPRIKITN